MTASGVSALAGLRPATAADAEALARIYNPYILDTIITFEETAITAAEMARRVAEVDGYGLPWLVAEQAGAVVGYAYATRWRTRHAYRFAVESTVYLGPEAIGRGIGTQLYEALFEVLRQRGTHAVIGGIALPNDASVGLHEKLGMRKVAHFPEVGFKFGRWIDVGYWQRNL
ncbi:MAG: N-acetyltransferase family protein [Pseudomonadales bacterium]